jgi:hypothetical protein
VFGWPDHACRGCSLGADQVFHLSHLNARDTTLAYASRAAAGHRAPEGAHGLEDALEGAPYPGCKEWAAELVIMKPTGQSLIID